MSRQSLDFLDFGLALTVASVRKTIRVDPENYDHSQTYPDRVEWKASREGEMDNLIGKGVY